GPTPLTRSIVPREPPSVRTRSAKCLPAIADPAGGRREFFATPPVAPGPRRRARGGNWRGAACRARGTSTRPLSRLSDCSVRPIRRLQRKLEAGGDAAIIHGLRGRPSNHQAPKKHKCAVLAAYRRRYSDFGPTFASAKRVAECLVVYPQTLRRWLLEA